MMLWAVPASVLGVDLAGLCAPGGYVDAILQAGRAARSKYANTSSTVVYSVPPIL